MNIKKDNGVTLVALVATIIILSIIAGISLYGGTQVIKQAKLENLRTNMLLIQAKAKEYVEEAAFKMGIESDNVKKSEVREDVYVTEAKLEEGDNNRYNVTSETLKSWGLSEIELKEGESYYIIINEENETVEVYNEPGFNGAKSLTEIKNIQL